MVDVEMRIREHEEVVAGLRALVPAIETAGERIRECLSTGNKVLFLGNGGSAADSQHLAAEIVGRFERERGGRPAIALTTDTSILTAVANDYGFERVFARQIEALCEAGDVVVAISTSGNSANVLAAARAARERGAFVLGMSGRTGGALRDLVDLCLAVPADVTSRIQEGHILIGHVLCEFADGVGEGE